MALNIDAIAKQYGKSADEIKELLAGITSVCPGETDDFYETAIALDVKQAAATGPSKSSVEYAKENATEYKVVVLGVSKVKDDNDFRKRDAWKTYRENKNDAVVNGVVEVTTDEDGKEHVIPLDNKKYLDKEKTKENPNYGKPIPYVGIREMLVAMDNKIFLARGPVSIYKKVEKKDENGKPVLDIDGQPVFEYAEPAELVKVGYKSQLWGNLTMVEGKAHAGVIRVWREAYSDEMGKFDDVWSVADTLLPNSQFFKELNEVPELPGYGYFVTHGYVTETSETEDGKKRYVSIGDKGDGKIVRASTGYKPLMEDVAGLVEGDEVFLIGERSSYPSKNDAGEMEWRKYNQLLGIIKSPSSQKMSDALAKLRAMRGQ